MKKVYILWYHYDNYGEENTSIEGIYASKISAEKKIEWYKKHYPIIAKYYEIEEQELLD